MAALPEFSMQIPIQMPIHNWNRSILVHVCFGHIYVPMDIQGLYPIQL